MTTSPREIKESPWRQGADERRVYALTTTPWGSSPTSVTVTIYPLGAYNAKGAESSATNMTGTVSVVGDVIETPTIHSLTPGVNYRVEWKFTIDGNVLEAYGIIAAEE